MNASPNSCALAFEVRDITKTRCSERPLPALFGIVGEKRQLKWVKESIVLFKGQASSSAQAEAASLCTESDHWKDSSRGRWAKEIHYQPEASKVSRSCCSLVNRTPVLFTHLQHFQWHLSSVKPPCYLSLETEGTMVLRWMGLSPTHL